MEKSPFYLAIDSIFNGWTALQLAVSNGFGGIHSREKALWMPDAVEEWFSENADIHHSELEEFLADVMNTEFDTVVDDTSLSEVAQKICGFYQLYKTGKNEEILERIKSCPKASLEQSQVSQDCNEDIDEDELVGESSMETRSETAMETNDTESSQNDQQQKEPSEDDEWTTVSRRNRKR